MTIHEPRTRHGDASDGAGPLGRATSRLDGPAKITGRATYALENHPAGLVHAVMIQATVGAGRVLSIEVETAKASPGVLLVLTPETAIELREAANPFGAPARDRAYCPFATEVTYNGQQVAAVVAETFEQATAAAALVVVHYDEGPVVPDFHAENAGAGHPMDRASVEWGEAETALAEAPVQIEATYLTPREYNVPIEPHGLVAEWEGDRLTVHEPSQWVDGMARTYAEWFAIPFENVRIVSPFIGGGFGSKALSLPHGAIAAMAAKMLGRPVKLAVTRPQTFTAYGGRPATRQTLKIGATKEGKLLSIVQTGANETSIGAAKLEPLGSVTTLMYAVPHLSTRQTVVPVNTVEPGALRAPGENPSAYGLECAMDELAYAVGVDPLALRLLNYAEEDPQARKPWSTRRLREAFAAGGEAFGWARRTMAPRSMREGRDLVGWGLAAGTYPVRRTPGEAMVRLLADGTAEVLSSAIDMGTGTYTILAQTAADALGLPVERVAVTLGDSRLPRAPVAGGSQLANLMTAAVQKAALAVREELVGLAINAPASPLAGAQANDLEIENGELRLPRATGDGLPIAALMRAIGRDSIEALRDNLKDGATAKDRFDNFTSVSGMRSPTDGDHSLHSWCAHFVEVRVDEDFGTVRVSRVVSGLDSGRLYNPKLAESQWNGGIVMGIGQALLEEGVVDPRDGRILNANLADYMIPTNADIPEIRTISVGVPDFEASALGGKAVGELAIVGVAPAIANAVFHATGKRIRHLPITLETLL
ncbi:xanthine dehydrogenase family protein molybdopterin-binding subunit [Aureimonas pseudogalii]|uniref:Xanthine dehydrogenase YagR molybdenum-binding subunit n=1 Tax=Aureimonas pseudogalii TaxID=1744844 RepID=A0A7W6E839_9HYPH|nr:xanthine dehydrogenase family protein molybdopterin-binding subunit [Aureimonas pseudogalii]MBB3996458.1 xanthine dehydrogenase YagR molybdenum-binding subunit [Aureimonas pseudogalii]